MVVRTRRPFYKSRPGRWLLISTFVVAVVAVVLPYLPLGDLTGFSPLPLEVMALILAISLLYVVATEAAKRLFYRRLGIGDTEFNGRRSAA